MTDCAAPEIYLANALGAKLNIKHGIIVPTDLDTRIFEGFIKECGEKRLSKGKKTLQGLFWKEITTLPMEKLRKVSKSDVSTT